MHALGRAVRTVLWRMARVVGQYVLVLVAGSWLSLVLSIVAGYLPYAVPGWHRITFLQKLEGIRFVSEFALFLGPFAIPCGFAVFLVGQLLKAMGMPRWTIRLAGALVSALVSGYVLVGLGWYVSLSEWFVYIGAAVGAAFGALRLPRALEGRPARVGPVSDARAASG